MPTPVRIDWDLVEMWNPAIGRKKLGITGGGAQGPQGFQGTQGSQGSQGNNGSQGAQGDQGVSGSQGVQGDQGSQGNQGPQGSQGTTGSQGNQGVQGTSGSQGTQGSTGSQGPQGDQGTQGTTGSQGNQGTQGTQGPQGSQGSQGNQGTAGSSVTVFDYRVDTSTAAGYPGDGHIRWDNATQISSTTLRISHLTDGNVDIDLILSLLLSGQDLIIQDSNASANFQQWMVSGTPTNFNPGAANSYWSVPVSLITSSGTGTTNFTNNHQIILEVIRVGPTGPQGPQGTQGTQGVQGAQGLQGSTGAQGSQGNQGNQGTAGTQGSQGTQGFQGFQGTQGVQGAKGDQGNQGNQGSKGDQGNQGNQGIKGDQGSQGAQGAAGSNGSQGSQGNQGNQGAQGLGVIVGYQSAQQNITSTSLVDIGGLVIACAANSSYIFEAVINCNAATGTNGAQFACQYSSATKGSIDYIFEGMTNATPTWTAPTRASAWVTASPTVCTTSAAVTQQRLAGYFTTGAAAANFSIQALKITSQTLGIFPGSWVKVTKVA